MPLFLLQYECASIQISTLTHSDCDIFLGKEVTPGSPPPPRPRIHTFPVKSKVPVGLRVFQNPTTKTINQ